MNKDDVATRQENERELKENHKLCDERLAQKNQHKRTIDVATTNNYRMRDMLGLNSFSAVEIDGSNDEDVTTDASSKKASKVPQPVGNADKCTASDISSETSD